MFPTDIGVVVNEFLVGHFNNILDYGFYCVLKRSLMKWRKVKRNGMK